MQYDIGARKIGNGCTRNKNNLFYAITKMCFFFSSWQQKRMTWVRENESEKECSVRLVHLKLWYDSETKKLRLVAVVVAIKGEIDRWMIGRGRLCRTREQRRVDGQVV